MKVTGKATAKEIPQAVNQANKKSMNASTPSCMSVMTNDIAPDIKSAIKNPNKKLEYLAWNIALPSNQFSYSCLTLGLINLLTNKADMQ